MLDSAGENSLGVGLELLPNLLLLLVDDRLANSELKRDRQPVRQVWFLVAP